MVDFRKQREFVVSVERAGLFAICGLGLAVFAHRIKNSRRPGSK